MKLCFGIRLICSLEFDMLDPVCTEQHGHSQEADAYQSEL